MRGAFIIVFLFSCLGGCSGEWASIRSDVPGFSKYSTTLRGYISKPDGDGPFPAVILMHGCGGLQPAVQGSLDNHASYLVQNGYAALILDSFSSRGSSGGMVCESEDQLSAARFYRAYDAYNAMLFLKKQAFVEGKNIFLVGQSNGGSVALKISSGIYSDQFPGSPRFRAIVAYYPWCRTLPRSLDTPVLVFGAGRDDWTSPDYCNLMKDSTRGESLEVVIYPEAHHSFDLPMAITSYLGHTVGGNPAATTDSRRRMVAFFEKHKN